MGNEQRSAMNADVDSLVGRVFGENYEIEALIGVGGMGRVYRATQRALSRTVGVKVIHPHLLEDEDTVARFYTEARAASSLNHPNSVSIYDFGRTDDGMLYLVMEFLRGRDLARVLEEQGSLSLSRLVEVACGVLAALQEAHARGVVHCDLKPENIIIERMRSGTTLVKVVDFGLAKLRGAETEDRSRGLVSGTPDYMSPEQARAIEVDGRGDLYSLGVVLFELLTGRLPFVSPSAAEVMTAHVMDDAPDPRKVAPERQIPDALARAVMRALAKAPEDRFDDADHMARALREALPAQPVGEVTRCGACGQPSEARRKFCGECGAPLGSRLGYAKTLTVSMPPGARSLLGRDTELAQLEALRVSAESSAKLVSFFGPPGVGKSRLLAAFAQQATRAGDQVVHVGPHPSGQPVAYAHIRQALAALLELPDDALPALREEPELFDSALSRAGLDEILMPSGLAGLPGCPRHEAAAIALAKAIEIGRARAASGRVVLLFDDMDSGDGLSLEVVRALISRLAEEALLVVVVDASGQLLRDKPCDLRLSLQGLNPALALHFLSAGVGLPELPVGGFSPLLAEQLRALRWEPSEAEPVAPQLADVVTRRLDELDAGARRVLQTLAVLGLSAPLERVRGLVSDEDIECVPRVVEAGLAQREGDDLRMVHPFVRDLVHLSIPAETRCDMHRRVLETAGRDGVPLEERVEHACRAGELMPALVLLERAGGDATQRGDARMAVRAFQRALELARRQLLETGDVSLDQAIATFSRRLGEALLRAGDLAQAAGVVREAIELVSGDATRRAQMLCVLAEVAVARDRLEAARHYLSDARALAGEVSALQVPIELAQSRVHEAEGDALGACNALVAAWAAATQDGPPRIEHAGLSVELAEAFMDMGDFDGARPLLQAVFTRAQDGDLEALCGRALGTLGSLEELHGGMDTARRYYRQAAEYAELAGDVAGAARWQRAVTELSLPPSAP